MSCLFPVHALSSAIMIMHHTAIVESSHIGCCIRPLRMQTRRFCSGACPLMQTLHMSSIPLSRPQQYLKGQLADDTGRTLSIFRVSEGLVDFLRGDNVMTKN